MKIITSFESKMADGMFSSYAEKRPFAQELIARALCSLNFLDGGLIGDDGWDGCPPELRETYLSRADAMLRHAGHL